MFWIPGLSIVVFFLLLVPLMIYGYKKGWVYALSFSIVLWLVTLMFVGINYLLYKVFLWEVFYNVFLKKSFKVSVDLNNLSNFYKTQVILFATGIQFILIYPMTFLIMFVLNIFIKKYFGHKYLSISKSKKEIVYRRNIKSSRVVGSMILTITTLFSASLVTSSMNVIITPYKKRNIANFLSDSMGSIYSLGLTNNSESAQIISDFMKYKLDQKLFNSIKEMVNFKSDETNSSNSFPEMEKVNYFESNQFKFINLYKDDEATKGIFSSIIKDKKTINPLTFDESTALSYEDAKKNIIGYNKNNHLNLASFFENVSNHIDIQLIKSLFDFLVKRFSDSFINFEKTVFYRRYKQAIQQELFQKTMVLNRQKELSLLKSGLLKLKNERRRIVETLERISGTSYDGNDSDFDFNLPIIFPVASVTSDISGTGTFNDEKIKGAETKRLFDEKNSIYQGIENIFNEYKTNFYDPMQSDIIRLEGAYDDSKKTIKDFKNNLKNLESKNIELRKKLLVLENKKVQLQLKIDNLNKLNIEEEEISTELALAKTRNELNRNDNEIVSINNQISINWSEINELKTNINDTENSINDQEIELNNIKTRFQNIKNEYSKKRNAKITASEILEKTRISHARQLQKIQNLKQEYSSSIEDLNRKNNQIINDKKKIDDLESQKDEIRFVGSAVLWNKADDGSIFYNQEYAKWWSNKKAQLEKIKNDKKEIFEDKKDEIIQLYKEWLAGSNEN